MARYKPQESNNLLLPVVLSDQLIPGSFAFALDYLVDNELNLTTMDARFNNDEVGASAMFNSLRLAATANPATPWFALPELHCQGS